MEFDKKYIYEEKIKNVWIVKGVLSMKIRKEDCNKETLTAIAEKGLDLMKDGSLTPETAQALIMQEYMKQIILEGKNIEFAKESQ